MQTSITYLSIIIVVFITLLPHICCYCLKTSDPSLQGCNHCPNLEGYKVQGRAHAAGGVRCAGAEPLTVGYGQEERTGHFVKQNAGSLNDLIESNLDNNNIQKAFLFMSRIFPSFNL